MKELKQTYLNNDEQPHLDARHGTTDILDIAFLTPSLKSRDIHFSVGESLGGDCLPIEIFLDSPLQWNIPIASSRYQFVKVDVNTFQNKMAEIFNSILFDLLTPKASDFMKEATDTSIPKVDYRENVDKIKTNKDTLKLIKLRRQYAKQKLPSIKSSIIKLQKGMNQKLNKKQTLDGKILQLSLKRDPQTMV